MNPAYLGGLIVGTTIGAFIVGGLLGWAIHKAARLDYRVADAIGVLLLPVVAIFGTAVERQGPVVAVTVYGLAALIAYFLLRLLRRWMRAPGSPKAGAE